MFVNIGALQGEADYKKQSFEHSPYYHVEILANYKTTLFKSGNNKLKKKTEPFYAV